MSRAAARLAATLALLALLAADAAAGASPESAYRAPASAADPIARFLARHWADPLPAQGEPPARFSPLEASLDPESCGRCHPQQLRDWKSSLHSRTMGPGVLWQFHVMGQAASNACMRCHAPLAEQKALMARELAWKSAPATAPPPYVSPDLHLQGLVCAACHVRGHERFGPPARVPPSRTSGADLPHGGFSPQAAFEDGRFCAFCHQFGADGARLNGKLLEDTYDEWRASPQAREGRTCQSCHMPERRHLWRGIHDPDMVRRALKVSLRLRPGRDGIHASADLANIGAGHDFPTYLVPEVVAILELVDARGTPRSELGRRVIGRKADLQLKHEISDTRMAPGSHLRIEATFPPPDGRGWHVRLRVLVDPGAHYERLFRSLLEHPERIAPDALPLLRAALARLESEHYEAYRLARLLPAR